VTGTDWPAAIEAPAAGAPDVVNGADGTLTDVIVNAAPPVLRSRTSWPTTPPMPPTERQRQRRDRQLGGRRWRRPSRRCHEVRDHVAVGEPPVPAVKPTSTLAAPSRGVELLQPVDLHDHVPAETVTSM